MKNGTYGTQMATKTFKNGIAELNIPLSQLQTALSQFRPAQVANAAIAENGNVRLHVATEQFFENTVKVTALPFIQSRNLVSLRAISVGGHMITLETGTRSLYKTAGFAKAVDIFAGWLNQSGATEAVFAYPRKTIAYAMNRATGSGFEPVAISGFKASSIRLRANAKGRIDVFAAHGSKVYYQAYGNGTSLSAMIDKWTEIHTAKKPITSLSKVGARSLLAINCETGYELLDASEISPVNTKVQSFAGYTTNGIVDGILAFVQGRGEKNFYIAHSANTADKRGNARFVAIPTTLALSETLKRATMLEIDARKNVRV